MHNPFPSWVNRCVSVEALRRPLSVVAPIGDKTRCGRFVRDVPLATDAPEQTASLFDYFVGTLLHKQRRTSASGFTRRLYRRENASQDPLGQDLGHERLTRMAAN